jgi:hypothetical protein
VSFIRQWWPYFFALSFTAVVIWLLATRRVRACKRGTCTYYVRYVPSFEPGETVPLDHHLFHVHEDHLKMLKDSLNYQTEMGIVATPSLLDEVRRYNAILRN